MPHTLGTVRSGIKDALRNLFAAVSDQLSQAGAGVEYLSVEQATREVRELLACYPGGVGGYELSALPADVPFDVLASAARTATTDSTDQANATGALGAVFILNLTAFTTAASLTLKLQRKNADGTYTDIFTAPAAITALGKYAYLVKMGIGASAAPFDGAGAKALPGDWRIEVVHGNGNSHTYSVAAWLLR